MVYILAVFLPPLGLLLNGQPFSAIFNLLMIVPCLIFGFIFPVLWLVPSLHAIIAVHMRREDRKHREIVDAIERRDGVASHDVTLKHFTEARDIRLAFYDEELIAAPIPATPSRRRR